VTGAVWHRSVCPSAHRTGHADFLHPAVRLDSRQDLRRCGAAASAGEAHHAEFSEHDRCGEWQHPASLDFMAADQKAPRPLMDMIVDGPAGRACGTVAEVPGPARQQAIEPIAHIGPRLQISLAFVHCTRKLGQPSGPANSSNHRSRSCRLPPPLCLPASN